MEKLKLKKLITGVDTKLINPEQPQVIMKLTPPTIEELGTQISFKYVLLNQALEHSSPTIRKIIESVPIVGEYKYNLVDVKVKKLNRGEFPCLPGYHLDCTMNPDHKTKPEIHHIYIFGCNCKTKFVVSPIIIPFQDDKLVNVDAAILKQNPNIIELDEETLYRYNRFNLHAPSVAQSNGFRLLIRVTETDLITPRKIK